MLDIILTIPIVLLLFISPFLSPLRILQLLILNVALAEPYTAGAVMICLTPVIYYKIFKKNTFRFTWVVKKISFICLIWLGYSAFTLMWLRDFSRFNTEYIQLVLMLLLTIAFVHAIKTIDDVKSANIYLILCGCVVSFKCFFDSLNNDYFPNNYYAFISLVTCIAIPISFVNFRSRSSICISVLVVCIGFLGITASESRATIILGVLLIFIRFFLLLEIKKHIKWTLILLLFILIPYALLWYYNMNDDNILKSVTDLERNYSNLERLALLNQSIDIYLANPFGVGFGSTNNLFMSANSYSDLNYPHPHNSLAHIAVELGSVGIFIFSYLFYLCFSVISQLKKYKDKDLFLNPLYKVSICIVVVMFLFSFLDDMFFNGMFNFYCIMFLGYLYALGNFIHFKNINKNVT